MEVRPEYFGIDDTGILFTCDECGQPKFAEPSDCDDKQLFEHLVEGGDVVCGTCSEEAKH